MDVVEIFCTSNARAYPAGNMIIFQGEVPRNGFIVKSGSVKSYSIDDSGIERVVGFSSTGDFLPADWLFGDSSSASFYYETVVPTELYPIDKREFETTLSENAEATRALMKYMAHINAKSMLRQLALQQPNSSHKILFFLYYLAVRHGKEVSAGILNPGIPLTHQLIADNVGLTRETVATEMSKLKKEGVIVYKRKRYLIDKSLLVRTVGKDISTSFSTNKRV